LQDREGADTLRASAMVPTERMETRRMEWIDLTVEELQEAETRHKARKAAREMTLIQIERRIAAAQQLNNEKDVAFWSMALAYGEAI